jgi:hypothetical protein
VTFGMIGREKILIAAVSAALGAIGASWFLKSEIRNLLCAQTERRSGSLGILIPGYRSVELGGEKDNFIDGSMGGEDLLGGAGNDEIRGHEGDDFINGEAGNDVLEGGPGRDIVMGGPGDDTIIGIDSFELIDGGDGEDTLIMPYRCRKFTLESIDASRKTIRSGCGADLIAVNSVEHVTVEPAPMQGPLPRPKADGSHTF